MSDKKRDRNDALDSAELASIMGYRSRAAINMRRLRGHPLPPCINIPGTRGYLWLRGDVDDWLLGHKDNT